MFTKSYSTPEPATASDAPAAKAASSASGAPAGAYLDLLVIAGGAGLLLLLSTGGYQGADSPLAILRLLLAVVYLLLVPGYLLQLVVFPRREEMDGPDRLALSFALSVAIIPPLALLLDWLPWGLALRPVLATWSGLLALLTPSAALRRWRQDPAGWFTPPFAPDLRSTGIRRGGRLLPGLAALALLTALLAGTGLALAPHPADRFTEFYLLGDADLAEGYPSSIVAGQPLALLAGIHNHEGQALAYSLRLRLGERLLLQTGDLLVADRATLELPLRLVVNAPAPGQALTLELLRAGDTTPYRTLRLPLEVREAGE